MKDATAIKRTQRMIIIALVAADIVLAILVGSRFFARLDLSRNRIYTLSATSKKILADLPEQLAFTYYVSDKLRTRYPFPAQIEDLLNEYATYSRGKVSVTSLDPSKAKQPPDLDSLGIVGQQMQVVEREEYNVATVYSGIVIQYLDSSDVIPFVSDLSMLEYDITSRIKSIVSGANRVVGLVIGDSQKTLADNFSYLQQEIQSQFELREIQPGEEIPGDISVLFVLGGTDLDEYDMLPIDQYIMRGGKALFAVDAVAVNVAAGLTASVIPNTAARDSLASYGVQVREELLLDVLNQRIQFRVPPNQLMIMNYPHWVTISNEEVSAKNPVTSRFSGLDLFWPSPLDIVPREGITAEALVKSSEQAWVQKGSFNTDPTMSQFLSMQAEETGQYTAAVALSGSFASAFAGKPLPARKGEEPSNAPLLEKSPETRIIVIGDSDFASNMVQYTQATYNLTFLSNCAEWLAQSDDLLAIKTRAQVDTRLNRIQSPERKAFAMSFSQIFNVAVVPLLVIAAGITRLLLRRRRKLQSTRAAK